MSHVWTTADEINFVREIGMHSATLTPKRTLLERYRSALRQRHTWGRIQPDVVLNETGRQLERFRTQGGRKK